jgi:hypothetical protein
MDHTCVRVMLAVGLVTGGLGCGSAHEDAPSSATVEMHPRISGPLLVEIKRLGSQGATSDTVTFGADGSAVVIQSYGGGGYRARRCRLSAAERDAVARDARRLPLDRAPHRKPRRAKSFYLPPPTFTVIHAGQSESFTGDAMPADGRALARHLTRVLSGHEGRCRTTFAQRRS